MTSPNRPRPKMPLRVNDLRRPLVATVAAVMAISCAGHHTSAGADPSVGQRNAEHITVLAIDSGVTATIVAPEVIDPGGRVELILYALPNGNSTAETIGGRVADTTAWRYDIQHIGAQTRALRGWGLRQAIVVYLEAEGKSWPTWRRVRGYDSANARIVSMVERIVDAVGRPRAFSVTLTGHSGGGSFMFGYIEGQAAIPDHVDRIAFLDANYNFDGARHAERLTAWLRRDPAHVLVSLGYDDREIMLDGRKVVSDSGGTWRATDRMLASLRLSFPIALDTLGDFHRYGAPQVELLRHPNPANRILHTVMIGDMNGYMHAVLTRRPEYERQRTLLRPRRAYERWVEPGIPPKPGEAAPRMGRQ